MPRQPKGWREVVVAGVDFLVNLAEPVAVIRSPGSADLTVSWPDLDVGLRTPSVKVVPAPTGAWALYTPLESEDPATPPGTPAAVHLAPDGALTRFEGLEASRAVGATHHGLWVGASRLPNTADAAAWSTKNDLWVLGVDGSRRRVRVDRPAAFAFEGDDHATLLVYAQAPVQEPPGGTGYVYQYVQVGLPAGDLPSTVEADVHASPFERASLLPVLNAATSRDVPDGPADQGVRWKPVELSRTDHDAAVAAVQHEFADLVRAWREADGSSSQSRGVGDPTVEVVGEWPGTRVEVSFRHPHYPEGRLRRTISVFDGAGRVSPASYASVHLMERLATGSLPPTRMADNGILEI